MVVGIFNTARRWIRGLYDWTLHWAETPQSLAALFSIAVIESSVFPVPPDVLLIAIVAARPLAWLRVATICAAGSLIGAIIGYLIGLSFMATLGSPIIAFYGVENDWERFLTLVDNLGIWFLAAAAFTPIPFKVATIASGAAGLPFVPFLLVSAAGRSARFFLVAGILRIYGLAARKFLERHFEVATLVFFVLLVSGFAVISLF